MQYVAMITMVIDHAGIIWFPDMELLRVIGRMAFPVYAFYVVQGMHYTSNRSKYVMRLGGLALVSQLPYMVLFATSQLNVICTLFLCVIGLYGYREERFHPFARGLCLMIVFGMLWWIPFDYGVYALFLMIIYEYTTRMKMILSHFALNLVAIYTITAAIQIWSIIPTIAFAIPKGAFWNWARRYRAPKWLWRAFYPVHLLILIVMAQMI